MYEIVHQLKSVDAVIFMLEVSGLSVDSKLLSCFLYCDY